MFNMPPQCYWTMATAMPCLALFLPLPAPALSPSPAWPSTILLTISQNASPGPLTAQGASQDLGEVMLAVTFSIPGQSQSGGKGSGPHPCL